jgi:hypothetical protein
MELPIARNASTVIVHPSNPWVTEITLEELKQIWGWPWFQVPKIHRISPDDLTNVRQSCDITAQEMSPLAGHFAAVLLPNDSHDRSRTCGFLGTCCT